MRRALRSVPMPVAISSAIIWQHLRHVCSTTSQWDFMRHQRWSPMPGGTGSGSAPSISRGLNINARLRAKAALCFVRLGFNYVRGLRVAVVHSIVAARAHEPFTSLRDLMLRVPELNKKEVAALAELGALNGLPKDQTDRHRRGAAWQASIAATPVGPLLEAVAEENDTSPLLPLTPTQCVFADFARSGLTIGKHPMAFHRARLERWACSTALPPRFSETGRLSGSPVVSSRGSVRARRKASFSLAWKTRRASSTSSSIRTCLTARQMSVLGSHTCSSKALCRICRTSSRLRRQIWRACPWGRPPSPHMTFIDWGCEVSKYCVMERRLPITRA
jgi:hypothetical protein